MPLLPKSNSARLSYLANYMDKKLCYIFSYNFFDKPLFLNCVSEKWSATERLDRDWNTLILVLWINIFLISWPKVCFLVSFNILLNAAETAVYRFILSITAVTPDGKLINFFKLLKWQQLNYAECDVKKSNLRCCDVCICLWWNRISFKTSFQHTRFI